MDNFDFKKYLAEGRMLKENTLKDDIKDFLDSIDIDNYQRSKDNDPDFENVDFDMDFFLDMYPKYAGKEEEIKSYLETSLNEVQLDPENQKLKDQYIDAYLSMAIDPYYYDEDAPSIVDIEKHAKEYEYEDTLKTIDNYNNPEIQGSRNTKASRDPLATKSPGNSIDNLYMRDPMQNLTKKGKMNKLDIDRLKMKIRQNLGM
jgi:hypothetical protein